jgi:hypothetical protein
LVDFSNILKKAQIEKLAEADEHEVVREVQEYFCDYLAINSDLFSLDMESPRYPLYSGTLGDWDGNALQRTIDGLMSICLALKRRPVIRYAGASPQAKRLGHELSYVMQQEGSLFDGRGITPVTLLLLDRRLDSATPLLSQWTYQAMVHELLGIKHGLVDVSHVEGIREDMKQVVLSVQEDPFYKSNMFSNFGDLGLAIKSYLAEYQSRTHSQAKIESIADMKKFVDEYPEVRKLGGNVSKHVALTSELSRLVDQYKLLEVSECEQNVTCTDRDHSETIANLLRQPEISDDSKLKLVLLFVLRNDKSNNIPMFTTLLKEAGVPPAKLALLDRMVKYSRDSVVAVASGGTGGNAADAFLDSSRVLSLGKSVIRGLKGVENVYTQHTPPLYSILEMLSRGKLKEAQYPFLEGNGVSNGFPEGTRVNDMIAFMVGGVTFEEARFVHQLTSAHPHLKIVAGGNTVHNSQTYGKAH